MIEQLTIIELEWNQWNAYVFNLLRINDRALLGINYGPKRFLYFHVLFTPIKLFDKTD